MKELKNVNNIVGENSARPPYEEITKRKNAKGITLIALIITIVVMLILVVVSMRVALNTGLFESAGKATKNWKTTQDAEANMTINIAGQEYGSIDAYLQTMKGIENKSITVTSSMQEIKFENTIKEYNISNEKEGFNTYEVMGIALTKEGEYITTGNITGKSGNIEIVGDIKDTTFKYNLTTMMKGDEIFYCKVNIDGEEYFQELKVIQGDVVRYEENYLTFVDSTAGVDGNGQWYEVEGEMWSGGTAMKISCNVDTGKASNAAFYEFDFQGSRIDLVFGQEETAAGFIVSTLKNEADEKLKSLINCADLNEPGTAVWKILDDVESNCNYKMITQVGYMNAHDKYKTGFSTIVVDAIEIYR